MVEVILKPETSNWNSLEDPNLFTSEGLRWRLVNRPRPWRPPTDVYETEEAIIVRVEIAGMKDADFIISLEGRHLSIRGIRADVSERRAYYQMEIPFGEFDTEIELPSAVIVDEVQASYREGFLKVVLPKARPRCVRVEVEE
jgi:HSP20 family protein